MEYLGSILEVLDSAGNALPDSNPDDAIFSGTITVDGNYVASVRSAKTILNGSLYTYNPTRQTWPVARAPAAATAGSQLVSVNSLEEQQLLVTAFGEGSYGLDSNDVATEGTFLWDSGDPLTFQNWNGGIPSSNNTSNNYAYFGTTGGRWVLANGSNTFPSVTEEPAPAGSQSISSAGPLAQYVLGVTISDLIPPRITDITRLPVNTASTTELISKFSLTTSEDYQPTSINKH